MLLNKAAFYVMAGLILSSSSTLWAEPGFSTIGDPQIPQEVRAAAETVLEIWTPGQTVPLQQEYYSERRKWLEGHLNTSDYRHQINLIELDKCERRRATVCFISETVSRSSAFVLKGGVVQTVRRAFSWDQSGLSQTFALLAAQWQEELRFPELQSQTKAAIAEFIANPMGETVFLLTDKAGNIVFNSLRDKYAFERYGPVQHFSGRVEIGGTFSNITTTKAKGKAAEKKKTVISLPARVYLWNDDMDLDSPTFGGLPWVANDFAQIKIEKVLPQLEAALLEDCQPGAKLFSAGYPEASRGRAKLSARDSYERELSITRGKALTMAEFAKNAQGWPHLAKFLASLRGRTYLVTDADGESGMQGGPILTEQGKVCGILKDSIQIPNRGSLQLTIPF